MSRSTAGAQSLYNSCNRAFKSQASTSWFFLTGVGAFAVYCRTLLPTVGLSGDTPKFQLVAAVWGIPHPPGYPLYIFLGKLFGLLPIGNMAYRMNLLSAVMAAATVVLLCWLVFHLTESTFSSVMAALVFAFSRLFWSQAVIAEVYTLNSFFVAAVTLSLFVWGKRRQRRYLYLALILYALSFGNHLTMIMLLPALVYWVLVTDWRVLTDLRSVGVGLLAVLGGASQYLYIFLRARQHPPLCEQCPDTPLRFWHYITASSFRDLIFSPTLLEHPLPRISIFLHLAAEQFFPWGTIMALVGAAVLWRCQRGHCMYLILAFVAYLLWGLNFRKNMFVYFIPCFMVTALWIGVAWDAVEKSILRYWRSHTLSPRLGLNTVALALVLWPLMYNFVPLDQSHNRVAEDFARRFMKGIEDKAIIYTPSWGYWQVLHYWLLVEEPRPDIDLLWQDRRTELDTYFGRRPIYSVGTDFSLLETYVLDPPPTGALHELLRRIPAGRIVILAAKDEASLGLTGEAIEAFRSIGIATDLRGCGQCGHVAVGVKGAEPGSALELSGRGLLVAQLQAGESIGTTGVATPVDLVVRSAGLDDGNVGDIFVNGRNVSPGGRGYNVVVLNPVSGAVEQVFNRDTCVSPLLDGSGRYRLVGQWEGDHIRPADEHALTYWEVPAEGIIQFGDVEARRYMGHGWGGTEDWGVWAMGEEATLFVRLPYSAYTVTLEAMPFPVEGLTQRVALLWNGVSVGEQTLVGDKVQKLTFEIPASLVSGELETLSFRFAYARSPHEVSGGQSPDRRPLAVWFATLRFEAHN